MSVAMRAAMLVIPMALGSGCHCGPSGTGGVRAEASSSLAGALPGAPALVGRYLLIGDRIDALRSRAHSGWKAWGALEEWCTRSIEGAEGKGGEGAENFAVAFAIGQRREHGREAIARARRLMARDLRDDSYLAFGDILRGVAMVRDLCDGVLSDSERREFETFLDDACHELWFDNRGNGWGLEDPGNNYHLAFLEGTAFAALALQKHGHPAGARHLELLRDRLERAGGVLGYLAGRGDGGDWSEGTNYGQRAKQRLLSMLAAIVSMGGPDAIRRLPYLRDAVRFAVHQLQPDGRTLLPAGDLARDSAMLVSAYDRDYLQTAAFLLEDEESRRRVRWWIDRAEASYDRGTFRWSEGLHKDVLFPVDEAPLSPEAMAPLHHATGTGWILARSDWTRQATSLAISAGRIVDQSHAHLDIGAFTLFKGGWQAVDAATFGRSGGQWESGAHNSIHVPGHERRPAEVGGLVQLADRDGILHVELDGGGLLRARRNRRDVPLLNAWLRDFVWLKPNTLVVHDRVDPAASAEWRIHFAERPREVGTGHFESMHEGGSLSLRIVIGGPARVVRDDDLDGGPSRSWRVVVAPSEGADRGTFLAVMRVGMGSPPGLDVHRIDSADRMNAVRVDQDAIAFPSGGDRSGLSVGWYSSAGDVRRHVLVGLRPETGVGIDRDRSRVLVGTGATMLADRHGVAIVPP